MKKKEMEINDELYKAGRPYYVYYIDPETGKTCKYDINEISTSRWNDSYNSWVNERRPVQKFAKYIGTHAFTKLSHLENEVVAFIDRYTKAKYNEEDLEDFRLKIIKLSKGDIKNIEFKKNGRLWIHLQDRTIKIRKLTEAIENIEDDFPDIMTDERVGKCHAYALQLLLHMKESDTAVTGICYSISNRGRFLHSWAETTTENGEEVCLDATMNLLMYKEDFYKIWHTKPISTLTKQQFAEDLPKLEPIWNFGVKQYLLNREEALKVADKLASAEQKS
ncbi:MAG: hypothetical protein J6J23_06050 [Clostridia bacterium]|nr:hypothetical protein [Clostridia bacterium]